MDQVYVFANPIAGQGRGKKVAGALARRLEKAGFAVKVCLEHCDAAPAPPPGARVRAAVAIGGDGTLRDVARWSLRQAGIEHLLASAPPVHPVANSEAPPEPIPLLVVPMGTANLMGLHLGVPWSQSGSEAQIVAAIRDPRLVQLDAARANDQLLLLVAGVGIDGLIVHELDRIRRGPINKLSYLVPAVRALATWRFPAIRVSVDGKPVFGDRPGLAFVGNIREYGTGFPILPDALPDDGLLDVCVLPCATHAEMLDLVLHAANGDHMKMDGAVYVKGRRIHVAANEPIAVQVDGDSAGFTPLDIELLPVRLPFIAPPLR